MPKCSVSECPNGSTRRGWCQKHYKRWQKSGDPLDPGGRTYSRRPPEERFWEKVDKTGTCWIWQGGQTSAGYGLFSNGGPSGETVLSHRFAWTAVKGPVPEGMHLDHLCRVRNCVNPEHLEPVTAAVNTSRARVVNPIKGRRRRGHECPHGHAYDAENTHVTKAGAFMCRTCLRTRSAARRKAERDGVPYRDPYLKPSCESAAVC